MSTASAAMRKSSAAGDRATAAGTRGRRKPGSGRELSTLSTAIFRGIGASSASGLARRLRRKRPRMEGQDERAWSASRRYSLRSPKRELAIA